MLLFQGINSMDSYLKPTESLDGQFIKLSFPQKKRCGASLAAKCPCTLGCPGTILLQNRSPYYEQTDAHLLFHAVHKEPITAYL